MTSTRTREIVRAYHDARNNKDMPAASDHLAENFSTGSFLVLVTGLDLVSELCGEG